jgi:xeroderma pigmentosum group C-complementing protein
LGLRARLVESLQACTFKVTLPKDETIKSGAVASTSTASSSRKGKKKKEVVLDESDTTRGSRQVISTPHRLPKKPRLQPHNKLAGM